MDSQMKHQPLEHYTSMLKQSTILQNITYSLLSSLKTSLFFVPKPLANENHPGLSRQMQEIYRKLESVPKKVQQTIRKKINLLTEVNQHVSNISLQFNRLMDLANQQSERSQKAVVQLKDQLQRRENQIRDCQNEINNQTQTMQKIQWQKQHYLTTKPKVSGYNQNSYIQTLNCLSNKIVAQINSQNRELARFNNNIDRKLNRLKQSLMGKWHSLSQAQFEKSSIIQTNPRILYNPIELAYLNKQRQIDNFEQSNFRRVNQKLNDFSEALLAQSRQYHSYQGQKQEVFEESQIVEPIYS